MKVLVTDDDADSRELVRLTLALHKIQVVEAAGGTECLKVAQEARPDAILLDVMMPSMDGPSTLIALRANPATASIPVIFLTASAMPAEIERLKKLGARAVVAKPFDPFALPAAVRELLGTPTALPPSASASARSGSDGLDELRAQFVRRSQARIDMAARLLGLLREDPDFHQRIVMRLADDRLDWRAEASEDAGRIWRKDLDYIFTRRADVP